MHFTFARVVVDRTLDKTRNEEKHIYRKADMESHPKDLVVGWWFSIAQNLEWDIVDDESKIKIKEKGLQIIENDEGMIHGKYHVTFFKG